MEDHVWKKAITYTLAFQRTHMSHREANVLYRACFLPAITYSFPATWLPDRFLERIQQLSTSTILNKMGLRRNLPRSLVFAPREIGGIGLCNLIHEQSVQKVLILLRHLRADTALGKALEVLIRTYQLWSGLSRHILEDTQPCPWIPSHWLSHLRHTMHCCRIQIRYNSWKVHPLRQQDRYLMEDCIEQNYSKAKLEQLNACRMYLQVNTLAEITDHRGTELLPQAFPDPNRPDLRRLEHISSSLLQWPTIAAPSIACWRIWSNMIQMIYTGSRTGTRLLQPLGPWISTYAQQRFWKWRMQDSNHLLFQTSPMTPTRVGLPTQLRHHLIKFSPTVPTPLEFKGPPVTPLDPTTGYIRLLVPPLPCDPIPPNSCKSYPTLQSQFRQELLPWQCELFGLLRKAGPTYKLHCLLQNTKPVIIVSNASVQKMGKVDLPGLLQMNS